MSSTAEIRNDDLATAGNGSTIKLQQMPAVAGSTAWHALLRVRYQKVHSDYKLLEQKPHSSSLVTAGLTVHGLE